MGWPAPSLYPYSPYNSAHQWIRAELSSLTPDDSTRQLSSKAAFLQQEQDHITTKPVVQKAPGVMELHKKLKNMQYHLEARVPRDRRNRKEDEKRGRVAPSKLYLLGFPSYPVVK